MNLSDKLSGFPHVYYFNMDEETNRREYMEGQFKYHSIDYTRLSSNRFDARKIDEWIDYLQDKDLTIKNIEDINLRVLANFVSHMVFLKE